jgi:hypothetical protein
MTASALELTVPAPVLTMPDSVWVVTPLQADTIKEALSRLGILDRWCHVVKGIRLGFDVGICGEPQLLVGGGSPLLHRRVHCKRVRRSPLPWSILPGGAQSPCWSVHRVTSWAGPKARVIHEVETHSRFVLSLPYRTLPCIHA